MMRIALLLMLLPAMTFADDLVLDDGNSLRGIVKDADGDAIAQARVEVALAAPRAGFSLFQESSYPECRLSTKTDNDGRFRIGPLKNTRRYRLLVAKRGFESRLLDYRVLGADAVSLVLKPVTNPDPVSRTVHARVTNEDGQPLAGALVRAYGAKTSKRRWWGSVPIRLHITDADGQFAMLLPEDYQGVEVRISADGTSGTTSGYLTPGEQVHRIELPTGTGVTGRLVRNGRPVAGLHIAVVQHDRSSRNHFIRAVAATTDDKGRFAFLHLPPTQVYVIYSPVQHGGLRPVLSTKKFAVKGSGETRDLGDLEVTAPMTVAGSIELPDGMKLAPDSRVYFSRDPAWDSVIVPILEDGSFLASGLPPEAYEIRIRAAGFKLKSGGLRFQQLSDQSFGLRLRKSIADLHVPLDPVAAEKKP